MRWVALLFLIVSCTKKDEAPQEPAVSAPPPKSTPNDVVWNVPPRWTVGENTSAMRKATYVIPRGEGDVQETLCTVSKAGGTVDQNVERWKGQFAGWEFKRSTMSSANISITLVEAKGESVSFDGGPKVRQEMVSAIVETAPELTFFKMVGSEKTVEAAKADLLGLLQSIRAK